MNTATGKGAFLTAGITFISTGTAMLTLEKWYIGVILALVGAAFIFGREFLKES